jgi:hypothetical protein
MGHTKERPYIGGIGKRKEAKNLKVVDVLSVQEKYINHKLVGATLGRGLRGVKRTSRDEPIGIVMHICMETTQGNSLCSYLYLKLAKISCFSYYLL